jgi:hypothetical protein
MNVIDWTDKESVRKAVWRLRDRAICALAQKAQGVVTDDPYMAAVAVRACAMNELSDYLPDACRIAREGLENVQMADLRGIVFASPGSTISTAPASLARFGVHEMAVGGEIDIPIDQTVNLSTLRQSISNWSAQSGRCFTTRLLRGVGSSRLHVARLS